MKRVRVEFKSLYRVVVVEDDLWVRKEVKRLIKEMNYEVVGEATNGQDAIKLVGLVRPDVLIMDIEMPIMGGIDAAKVIQENYPTPIVFLTAYDSADLVDKANMAGAGSYIVKPTDLLELNRSIKIAVARHADLMKIRDALENEKKLIKEIYHRVKNNLALIASLLRMQIAANDDKNVIAALQDTERRVYSMAKIHSILYSSDTSYNVELGSYLKNIATGVHQSFIDDNKRIHLKTDVDSIVVDSETAISGGLIVNELITNAIKHAFLGRKEGFVHLKLKATGDQVELIVLDNGVGLPEDFNVETQDSLGMQIVSSLATQIGGSLEFKSSGGSNFRLIFNKKDKQPEEIEQTSLS